MANNNLEATEFDITFAAIDESAFDDIEGVDNYEDLIGFGDENDFSFREIFRYSEF